MKRYVVYMASAALLAVVGAAGCQGAGDDPNSVLFRPGAGDDYSSLAAGPNTRDHQAQSIGGDNGITEPTVQRAYDAQIGSPEVAARSHGAQKIEYAVLGSILSDFGVTMTAAATTSGGKNGKNGQNAQNGDDDDDTNNNNNNNGQSGTATTTTTTAAPTAAALYTAGAGALGAPVYPSRVPEMILPSTSALAKEFDIFMAAAPQIIAGITNSKRCPGVTLIQSNQFTTDGLSCLMGKPAKPDHVALANQLVAQASDPTTGQAIAVATILAAAHISE